MSEHEVICRKPTQVDEEAKQLLDDVTAKMVEWEGKLVALGNAQDKAQALQVATPPFVIPASCHLVSKLHQLTDRLRQ